MTNIDNLVFCNICGVQINGRYSFTVFLKAIYHLIKSHNLLHDKIF